MEKYMRIVTKPFDGRKTVILETYDMKESTWDFVFGATVTTSEEFLNAGRVYISQDVLKKLHQMLTIGYVLTSVELEGGDE